MIGLLDGNAAVTFLASVGFFATGVAFPLGAEGESEESSLVYESRLRLLPETDFVEDDAGIFPSLSHFSSDILIFP